MAGLDDLTGLPESVRDSRLPVTFRWEGQQQFTIHTQGSSRRSKQSQEVWAHMGPLGQGGFASVELQATESRSNRGGGKQFRAVKSIRIPEEEFSNNRDFYVRELEAIIKFSSAKYGELFVKSFGWFTSQNVLHIAMEYCELGDLQQYLLKKCENGRLPENEAHDIASQVLDALASMHEEGFAHRDVKPANILIKSHPPDLPWIVKVADFGISRRDEDSTTGGTTTVRGTAAFMPPELLGFTSQNARAADLFAVDMWCYGETLYRVLTGDGAFRNLAELFGYYHGSVPFPSTALKDQNLSAGAIDFLRRLLTCSPAERLTATAALDHAWMEVDIDSTNAISHPTALPREAKASTSSFPMQDNSPAQQAENETTGASASWTDNFSTLRVDDRTRISKDDSSMQNSSRAARTPRQDGTTKIQQTSPVGVTDASASWTASMETVNNAIRTQQIISTGGQHPRGTGTRTSRAPQPEPESEPKLEPKSPVVTQDSQEWNIPHKNHPKHGQLVSEKDLIMLSNQGDTAQKAFLQKNFDQARELYEQHWEALKSLLGEEHPRAIWALARLVLILGKLERYQHQEIYCRSLVHLRSSTLGPEHKDTLMGWRKLGLCLVMQGRLKESVSIYESVIETCKRIGDTSEHSKTLESLVYVYLEKKRVTEAESTFNDLIEFKKETLGDEQVLESMHRFACTLKSQAYISAARKIAQQAFSLIESMEAKGESLTANTRKLRSELSWAEPPPTRSTTYTGSTTSRSSFSSGLVAYKPPKKSKVDRIRGLFS